MCSIIGYIGHRLTAESVKPYFDRTISRGPDMSRIISIPGGFLGFHRLAIRVRTLSWNDLWFSLDPEGWANVMSGKNIIGGIISDWNQGYSLKW